MEQIGMKMNLFLSKDRDPNEIIKKIKYSNYRNHETELSQFCLAVNSSENYDELKAILKTLKISLFCENPNMFIETITDKSCSPVEISKNLNNLITLAKCEMQAVSSNCIYLNIDLNTAKKYGYKQLDLSLQNYGYFLYQEDSPIVYSAQLDYNKAIKRQGIEKVNTAAYLHYLTMIEYHLKLKYKRLVNQLLSIPKMVGYNFEINSVIARVNEKTLKDKHIKLIKRR